MYEFIETIARDESGQDMVEYVLLIALLALAVLAALEFLGGAVVDGADTAGQRMQSAGG